MSVHNCRNSNAAAQPVRYDRAPQAPNRWVLLRLASSLTARLLTVRVWGWSARRRTAS
jgi:hypothetical protein